MRAAGKSVFPDSVRCRLPWRPYQAQVLAAFERSVADRHFHIVAAPGSGKTILGLEAARRAGRPTLVLAPTLALRDQWLARFRAHFTDQPASLPEGFTSTDLTAPGILTVLTYQALDAVVRYQGTTILLDRLTKAGVTTLVLDEAHHLRQQWWAVVQAIKAGLQQPFVIALTATPPFDAVQVEWNRYLELCGEVDEEIAVPELVQRGELCPHQDYLYFSAPAGEEALVLRERQANRTVFLSDLCLDIEFVEALARHPVVVDPVANLAKLLECRDYFLSVAIFLNYARGMPPTALLEALGLEEVVLPSWQAVWAETLLNGVLGHDRATWPSPAGEVLDRLEARLRRDGLWERRRAVLAGDRQDARRLRSSVSKLSSIGDIVELESRQLGERLRCVVLTDHIRDLPAEQSAGESVLRLGAVPAFDRLRRLRLPGVRLALLTGRRAIVLASSAGLLKEVAGGAALNFAELAHDPGFVEVRSAGLPLALLVDAFTKLFNRGDLNVLVGTAALLGEGWDAPAVNTLVLATSAGTHVASNQLRGRAIRVDPARPDKTANIWHLACLALEMPAAPRTALPADEPTEDRWDDWEMIQRRFLTFAAPAVNGPTICNGVERLGLGNVSLNDVSALNARMCSRAGDRQTMVASWRSAVGGAANVRRRLATDLLVPRPLLRRSAVAVRFGAEGGWFRWWSQWRELRQARRIARAVFAALQAQRFLKESAGFVRPEVSLGTRTLLVRLAGADGRAEAVFIQAMREVFDPLTPPRYLLIRRQGTFGVPRCLSGQKRAAVAFWRHWRRHVGRARLVYAHSEEGRWKLLRAQERFLAARADTRLETRLTWR